MRSLSNSGIWVWVAFILAHLWLGYLNLYGPANPMGDVSTVYRYWVARGVYAHVWVGLDVDWVYPILALVPMVISWAFGEYAYSSTWLSLVLVLDIVGFGVLTNWGRNRERFGIAWWWVAFILLLGPVALVRIDSITVPIAVIAVVVLARRPRLAAVLLTVATWIKIWPAAIIGALLIASARRWRVLAATAITSLVIVVGAVTLGGGASITSFVSQQTGRGLQIEAPISTVWMWLAAAHVGGSFVYYDTAILTFQVAGTGAVIAAALMTPVLAVAVLAVVGLGVRAARAGAHVIDVLAPLTLSLVLALMVFNKVGSPQFEVWLIAPTVLGLINARRGGVSFVTPATVALVIAALTQVIYPYLYDQVLQTNWLMLMVLTARNGLLIALFAWALAQVWRAGSPFADHIPDDDDEASYDFHPATPWPLGGSTATGNSHESA